MNTLKRAFSIVALLGSLSLVGTLIGLNAGNAQRVTINRLAGDIEPNHSYSLSSVTGPTDDKYQSVVSLDSGSSLTMEFTISKDWVEKSGATLVGFGDNGTETKGTLTCSFDLFEGVSNPSVYIMWRTSPTKGGSIGTNRVTFTTENTVESDGAAVFNHGVTWHVQISLAGYSVLYLEALTLSYSC